MEHTDNRLVAVKSLRNYFREAINEVVDATQVKVDSHTSHYVVNLITVYARSDSLYKESDGSYGILPLVKMMANVVDNPAPMERAAGLQRIGDISLFVAGFFEESFDKKPIGIDYYISMGEHAYNELSVLPKSTTRSLALVDVYQELARKFKFVVDILHEVKYRMNGRPNINALRIYEIWLRTGSKRAEALLRDQGIISIRP